MVSTRQQKQRCLVTGGSGFLGKHLVQQLVDSGEWQVTVFDIRAGADERATTIVGDLRSKDQVLAACTGEPRPQHTGEAAAFPTCTCQALKPGIAACHSARSPRI